MLHFIPPPFFFVVRTAHIDHVQRPLPSTDNEASHQEDEENNSPSDWHSQNGGLVRVPDSKNIYKGDKE